MKISASALISMRERGDSFEDIYRKFQGTKLRFNLLTKEDQDLLGDTVDEAYEKFKTAQLAYADGDLSKLTELSTELIDLFEMIKEISRVKDE